MASGSTLAIFDALAARPTAASGAHVDLRNDHPVLVFGDAADESASFAAALPNRYAGGSLLVRLTWAADAATSGDVRWSASLETQPASASFDLDTDDYGSAVASTETTAAAAGRLSVAEITLTVPTSPTPIAGESYRVQISRLATDAVDTLVGDAQLLSLEIREG